MANMDPRTVRVFVSSTFRDFAVERDLLAKRVFPELRHRARARSLDVVGVDLRWGVTESQSQRGQTLPICLREIERSRPFFLGLLGERYGWIPNEAHFSPVLIRMQPWLRQHLGGASLTELEILHGVLNHRAPSSDATLLYFRDPNWSRRQGRSFRPENVRAETKLRELKQRIIASGLSPSRYRTPSEFCRMVTEDLWRRIDKRFPEHDRPDSNERVDRTHQVFADERRRLFVGRHKDLLALEGAALKPHGGQQNLIVVGAPGMGKSSLLANLSSRLRSRRPRLAVFDHYMGSGGDAGSPIGMLLRFRRWFASEFGSTLPDPSETPDLRAATRELLEAAGRRATQRGRHVVLVIDALDKSDGSPADEWIPARSATGASIVASHQPGEVANRLRSMGLKVRRLRPIDRPTAREIIVEELAWTGRSLESNDVTAIVRHAQSGLPAFIKSLIDELCLFGSHERLHGEIRALLAADSPESIHDRMLARLEAEHGKRAISSTFAPLCLGSEGMSESQLISFARIAPASLASIRLAVESALYEVDGRIRPAHDLFRRAVLKRYCGNRENARKMHTRLARWWCCQEIGPTDAFEAFFHAYWSGDITIATRMLGQPATGICILEEVSASNLMRLANRAATTGNGSATGWIESTLADSWVMWRRSLRKSRAPDALHRLWNAGFELMAALEHAGAVSNRTVRIAKELVELSESLKDGRRPDSKIRVAMALDVLGRQALHRGDIKLALRSAERCSLILRRACGLSSDLTDLGRLASAEDSLSRVASLAQRPRIAISAMHRALAVSRKRLAVEKTGESVHDLVIALVRHGVHELDRGLHDRARPLLTEALSLARSGVMAFGEKALHGARASALFNLGRLELERDRPRIALRMMQQMVAMSTSARQSSASVQDRQQLASAYSGLADALSALGDRSGALRATRQAVAIWRSIVSEHDSVESRREYCVTVSGFADMEEARGRRRQAFNALRPCVELLDFHAASGCQTPELAEILREARHRMTYLAVGRRWRTEALPQAEELLRGARRVARGDQSPLRSCFLLRYLHLRMQLRCPSGPGTSEEATEVMRHALRVSKAWEQGPLHRRAIGLTRSDIQMAVSARVLASLGRHALGT